MTRYVSIAELRAKIVRHAQRLCRKAGIDAVVVSVSITHPVKTGKPHQVAVCVRVPVTEDVN